MEIPLTSFIDFVLKSGKPKITCAIKIKTQMGITYSPVTDYYKRFREAVIQLHEIGLDKKKLEDLIGSTPSNKEENYKNMVAGYLKFLGKKKTIWFKPSREKWKYSSLEIPVNPELGLEWNDTKYLIKLYLKSDNPSKNRVASILTLMNETLPSKGYTHAVLDVRNGKLHTYDKNMSTLMPLVEGEAMSLELMLSKV